MSRERVNHYCPLCGSPTELLERFGIERPVCTTCGHIVFFAPAVAVLALIVQNDHVLLVQRANDPKKGLWVTPAGFMEWYEDPVVAIRREVLEETNLDVRVDRLIDVFHTPDDGGLADVVIAYAASVIGGELQAADDAQAAAWFTRGSLPELAFLPTQRVLARWVAGEL
ncbi:MAG: NUDIX domain-containing protein [Chloroflexi bacterium]|nr:NUDIX domain-containing protein [Chloroflexota bacterium]MCC6894255.1 NUDIX hydrolase [Anaerolineae bacterium]